MLNGNFVNTCILFRDLSELIDNYSDEESVGIFARTIKENYVGAVDIQVLSPEAEMIVHQPENKLHRDRTDPDRGKKYLTLLAGAAKGEAVNLTESTQALDLSASKQLMEVLNVFRGPGNGYQDYTTVEIDATTFEQGGVLIINIQVGEGEAPGSFDLFAGDAELPTEGIPYEALASEWDIPPGDTGQIRHRFTEGQKFKLGGTGNWFCEKGSLNAFLVRVSVVPLETTEAEAPS